MPTRTVSGLFWVCLGLQAMALRVSCCGCQRLSVAIDPESGIRIEDLATR
ncbi:hypothetical protein [Microcoleus sp. CAWBG58]|nr:hypothetical protein [Microcoleus sp. CAWBG58]